VPLTHCLRNRDSVSYWQQVRANSAFAVHPNQDLFWVSPIAPRPRNPNRRAISCRAGEKPLKSSRCADGFKKAPQFRCCLELRDRIEFLERRCERVRQAPHGSGLELLVLRIEIQLVHSPRQASRDVQTPFHEKCGRSLALLPLLTTVEFANSPPAASTVQSSAASGPRRSTARLRARNASSVSLGRGCNLPETLDCDTRTLAARPCMPAEIACCSRF